MSCVLPVKGIRIYIFYQFGWLVSDNVSVNDMAVRYVCKELKPHARKLNAKKICGWFVI